MQCWGQTGGDSQPVTIAFISKGLFRNFSFTEAYLVLAVAFFFSLDVPLLLIVNEIICTKSLFIELLKRNCSYICLCSSWHSPGLVCHLKILLLYETLNSCYVSQINNFLPFSQEYMVGKFLYQFISFTGCISNLIVFKCISNFMLRKLK